MSALVDFLFLSSCSYKRTRLSEWRTIIPLLWLYFFSSWYLYFSLSYSVSLSVVTSVNVCGYQNLFIFSWILNDTLSAYRLLGCHLYGPSILKIPSLPICLCSYFSCIFSVSYRWHIKTDEWYVSAIFSTPGLHFHNYFLFQWKFCFPLCSRVLSLFPFKIW